MNTNVAPKQIAILVSGMSRGSNMSSLINACIEGEINGAVSLVCGTRVDAPSLEIARDLGAHTTVVSPRKYEGNEDEYGNVLLRILINHSIDLICLAGYMRVLPTEILAAYTHRVMNIHPALLPLFGGKGMFGLNVHKAVLESGMKVSGATVHLVDEDYDSGPIVIQGCVPVEQNDTPELLSQRVLTKEHEIYKRAVQLYCADRLSVVDGKVVISS